MMPQKLVVVGNGMAPGRMLERLFIEAPGTFDVTIFNAEPRVNYDRIMLSPVLSGEKRFEDIVIHGDGWYERHGVTLLKGERVVSIDRDARTVTSAAGTVAPYDKLVIATGSVPFVPPIPGSTMAGVLTYRDLDDVEAMILAAQSGTKAVVIGGGLLGLEAAAGLKAQGLDVTVVHLMPTLMERQLDPAAGRLLAAAFEARGITVLTGANTKAVRGETHATGVELADGRVIEAGLVVMAVGIRPSATLAREARLAVGRGILVDAHMRTSDPDILALGECAEVDGRVYGLVAPLYRMAEVAAQSLLDRPGEPFHHLDTPTKLKVSGMDLYSVGDFAEGEGREEITFEDAAVGVYKRLVVENGRLVGAVLFGETGDGGWFSDLVGKGAPIADMREALIFGSAFAPTPMAA